jgi:hypothetical protein
MDLMEFEDLFVVNSYFFILKERAVSFGWKSEEWYLGKLNKKLRVDEHSNYLFSSNYIYYFDEHKEQKERLAHKKKGLKSRFRPSSNPSYSLEGVLALSLEGYSGFEINDIAYYPKNITSVSSRKLSFFIDDYVEKKMASMGYAHIFKNVSRLLD